jgi:hypothetical protein
MKENYKSLVDINYMLYFILHYIHDTRMLQHSKRMTILCV